MLFCYVHQGFYSCWLQKVISINRIDVFTSSCIKPCITSYSDPTVNLMVQDRHLNTRSL